MFVEVSYPIYDHMPLYPGLPDTELRDRERIANGDAWNGTVMTIYTHAGTHVDAPSHYRDGATTLDRVPLERFMYDAPLMVEVPGCKDYLISVEDVAGAQGVKDADFLLFNTGWWKLRDADFYAYAHNFPALSAEAAAYIRKELPQVKAVAIDTLSIENLGIGATNGYATHNTLLNDVDCLPCMIYEDYDPSALVGKTLRRAFATPLRLVGREATPINLVVEVEED